MNYEKKYNEALKRAREYYAKLGSTQLKLEIEGIFPELAESEDERIRKELIGGLMWQRDNLNANGRHDDNLILPGFTMRVGDLLAYLEKLKERKPAEWSEEDEHRITDAIYFLESAKIHYADTSEIDKTIAWLKSLPERFNLQPKQEWSEEDKTFVKDAIEAVENYYSKGCGQEELVSWLKSLRPHPQWVYQQTVECLRTMCDSYEKNGLFTDERARDFLGNVRVKCKDAIECAPILDEPSWKPSEEQMEALKETINQDCTVCNGDRKWIKPDLESLYEQLKAL